MVLLLAGVGAFDTSAYSNFFTYEQVNTKIADLAKNNSTFVPST